MHPADIKAALQKRGYTQARMAAVVDRTEGAISQVINGHSRSKYIAKRISAVTGLPVSVLWPGRYPSLELNEIRNRKAA